MPNGLDDKSLILSCVNNRKWEIYEDPKVMSDYRYAILKEKNYQQMYIFPQYKSMRKVLTLSLIPTRRLNTMARCPPSTL